jgi:hypothetical protein
MKDEVNKNPGKVNENPGRGYWGTGARCARIGEI